VHQVWFSLPAQSLSGNGSGSTSIFAPAGSPAHSIFDLSMLVLAICTAIFLTVGGLLLYVLVRYRHRANDANAAQEPPQIYGSTQIELSWTVIPILIVVMLFLATARIIFATQDHPRPADALDVTVIGHQFWWEYRYPQLGIVTANELHVPVSDPHHPTPTYLTMSSADTDHSFWVPRLAGKTDLIPNRINTMWIDPQSAGLYLGQCAQYCGTQHAKMLLRVYADSPADFAAWVASQQRPAVEDPSVAAGRLHQLSYCGRNGGHGQVWPRPDSPCQPRYHCLRLCTQHPGQPTRFRTGPSQLQTRSPDASNASQRPRPRRRHRVPDVPEVAHPRKPYGHPGNPELEPAGRQRTYRAAPHLGGGVARLGHHRRPQEDRLDVHRLRACLPGDRRI
jgi:cytochrome c oxidase subunit 2